MSHPVFINVPIVDPAFLMPGPLIINRLLSCSGLFHEIKAESDRPEGEYNVDDRVDHYCRFPVSGAQQIHDNYYQVHSGD